MREHDFSILLINPPHRSIGSRIPKEQLPPLGLLCVGGPLIDAGFRVNLIDAEFGPMCESEIVERALQVRPHLVMMGHSGSTSAHPVVVRLAARLKAASPGIVVAYGGVFPTYHWHDILTQTPEIDVIVRGEGERTALRLARALCEESDLASVEGLAFIRDGHPFATDPAEPLEDLDAWRVGWELIDHARYSYWGHRRAVVVQFSRGCTHACSYCGQRLFWQRWRHCDPVAFAKELARLHREHGVEVINFADELPTGSRSVWKAFLEALVAENVKLTLVGSTRAGDIVRDADLLGLYKRAGVIRFLLGIESYDEATLAKINKGATPRDDREAIRLLRRHGIISMATYVVGFEEETDLDYWRSLKHLLAYDPDQIQLLYVTPHRWTPYFESVAERRVIRTDAELWDYKHQVLATKRVPAWRVMLWVKVIEAVMQLRPRALLRTLFSRDRAFAQGMRWYVKMGRRVWVREVMEAVFGLRPLKNGPTLRDYWAPSPVGEGPERAETRAKTMEG